MSTNAIEPHEEAARVATIAFGIFGAAAIVALVAYRRRELPRWVTGIFLAAGCAYLFVASTLE